MGRRKNFKGLRACHAIDVANEVLDRFENTSENVTEVQEMTLLLLTEIMFNTAVMVDLNIDADDSNERGKHDNQGNKQNDRRTP